MTSQYESIAKVYQDSKKLPFREYIEAHTFLKAVGDCQGKSILDLACGEGHYTRILKSLGAEKVVGVDLSESMIELARNQEHKSKLGVEYLQADAKDLPHSIGQFDLVLATYLFNYARNANELIDFAKSCRNHLKPGGRLIAINDAPENKIENFDSYLKYGFIKKSPSGKKEASPVQYIFFPESEFRFTFSNYYFSTQRYEEALTKAGFVDIKWKPMEVSMQGIEEYGNDYWSNFLEDAPIAVFSAGLD